METAWSTGKEPCLGVELQGRVGPHLQSYGWVRAIDMHILVSHLTNCECVYGEVTWVKETKVMGLIELEGDGLGSGRLRVFTGKLKWWVVNPNIAWMLGN